MDLTAGSRGSFFGSNGADTHSNRARSREVYHNGYVGQDGIDLCGTTLMLISEQLVNLSNSGIEVPEVIIEPNCILGTQIGESIKLTKEKIHLYTCGDVSRLKDGWMSVAQTSLATGNMAWIRECNRNVMKQIAKLTYNDILVLRDASIRRKK